MRRVEPRGTVPGAGVPHRTRRFLRLAMLLAVAVVALLGLWRVRIILLPFVFALALAYLLAPAVRFWERRRVPTWLAILLVYAALALGVAMISWWLVPQLVAEGRQLLAVLPLFEKRLDRLAALFFMHYRRLALPHVLRSQADALIAAVDAFIADLLRRALTGVAGSLPVLASLLMSPFLAYYVLRDRRRFAKEVWRVVPRRGRRRVYLLVHDLDRAVGGFIRGQIVVSLCIGVMALLVSLAFRLPFPLFIAFVAALTDIIPYLGPLLGALPAVTFALLRSPVEAVWVLAIFLAMHEFEGVVLSPWILGNEVGMHPLAVFLAILAGGDLFGFLGMLLAVPATAALAILASFAYRELSAWSRRGSDLRGRRPVRARSMLARFPSMAPSGRMSFVRHALWEGAGVPRPARPRGRNGAK